MKAANENHTLLTPTDDSNERRMRSLVLWLNEVSVQEPDTAALFEQMAETLEQLWHRENDPYNLDPEDEEQLRKDLAFSKARNRFGLQKDTVTTKATFGRFRFRPYIDLGGSFRLIAESNEPRFSGVDLADVFSDEDGPGERFRVEDAVSVLISRFAAGLPPQVARCRGSECKKWVWARKKNYKWCSEECRLRFERSKPDFKEKARLRMESYRAFLNKDKPKRKTKGKKHK